jgi:hypothetical protein
MQELQPVTAVQSALTRAAASEESFQATRHQVLVIQALDVRCCVVDPGGNAAA